MGNISKFSVEFKTDATHEQTWEATVTDGKVTHIFVYYAIYGGYSSGSSYEHTPEESSFEKTLTIFIKHMYQRSRKYEDFVNSLDQETLEKYFKISYVPK